MMEPVWHACLRAGGGGGQAKPHAPPCRVGTCRSASHAFFLACCCQVQHKEHKECMKERPEECEQFRYALFQCKRGQVDARTRIQGNKAY